MRKKFLAVALCTLLFALCASAQGQQAGKIVRIGYLDQSAYFSSAVLVNAFTQELNTLGWAERL